MDEKKACFIILAAETIGGQTLSRMREFAGSAEECLELGPDVFENAGILKQRQSAELRKAFAERSRLEYLYEKLLSAGVRIMITDDSEYPSKLRYVEEAPPILFVRGSLPDETEPAAAVIGARACSEYGIQAAEFFSGELARNGVQIVSGLAYGIDAAAARGALDAGGKSFAVLGSGIDICYPKENFRLYEAMCDADAGGVITEFHPGMEPLGRHFVMRNRIIAGLADVLLVIEAREKSGTSLTVDFALRQGKEVFAMPGRINDPLGRGCNKLIRDGATPLIEPGDVLASLMMDSSLAMGSMNTEDISALTESERRVYLAMDESSRHVEDIARHAGLDLKFTLSLLYSLEMRGYAVNTGSAYYRRR